jgi:membrane-bound lytic murein transglycosylase A
VAEAAEGALWRWQHGKARTAALSVERIEFADIEGWLEDDHSVALACYMRSVDLAAQPLPKPNTAASLPTLLADRSKARGFFETAFAPFRILAEPGLLTSYFEPVLRGSRTPSARFRIPVYRRPPDLEPLPERHPLAAIGLTAARQTRAGFAPYPERAEIEAGAIRGQGLELIYLDDAIDAFIMHVQGSGRIEFEDGAATRLTFDGKNGHPYRSIARLLIERGELSAEEADLDGMIAWLRAKPERCAVLNENKSYIFFRELETLAEGPRGSLGAELFAGRSLAVDPLYHTLGMPIWVDAPRVMFEGRSLRRLGVAQDTGSAIRGPLRADIFAGSGKRAGDAAGKVRHSCEFILLRPR